MLEKKDIQIKLHKDFMSEDAAITIKIAPYVGLLSKELLEDANDPQLCKESFIQQTIDNFIEKLYGNYSAKAVNKLRKGIHD